LLVARKVSAGEQRLQVVYRADGSTAEIRGLAETVRAARLGLDAKGRIAPRQPTAASNPVGKGGQIA
jgi:hypothetical protein